MKHLQLTTPSDLNSLLNKRKGEHKFGEHIKLLPDHTNIYESLKDLDVRYVIFGVEEDIGVIANNGNSGTYKTWPIVKKTLVNLQSNGFTHAKKVLILGSLIYESARKKVKSSEDKIKTARLLVEKIDKDVSFLVSQIVKAGKIPIVIGGGHNNAYGLIKGSALAFNKPINAVNIDAHTDFRPEEGRHSGNGFSYAFAEGFLKNYYILGLHENYSSRSILNTIKKLKKVRFTSYEDLEVRQDKKLKNALSEALDHVKNSSFGLELDCDAIADVPSSAASPSGFSVKQARRMIHYFGTQSNVCYFHICEAIAEKKSEAQVGKLISFFISDFIRAHES